MLQHLDEKVTLKSETDDDLVKQPSLVLTGEPEKLSDLKKIINNEIINFGKELVQNHYNFVLSNVTCIKI